MEREFKGVWIEKSIYLAKNMSWTEKILLIEIDSLDKHGNGCFASNEYLANFVGISTGSCANIISKFRKIGAIIDRKPFDGRYRFIGIDFTKILSLPSQKNEDPIHKNMKPAFTKKLKQPSQIYEHTNTVSNTISNIDYKDVELCSTSAFSPQKTNVDFIIPEHEEEKQEKVNSFFSRTDNVKKKEKKTQETKLYVWPANFPAELIPYAEKFLQYRKEIKKEYKSQSSLQTRLNQFLEQAEKYGIGAVIESIQTAIGNGWTGAFIDKKYLNTAKQQQNGNSKSNLSYSQQWALEIIAAKDEGIGYFLDNPSAW